MKRIVATLFALLFAPAAHAQSGLLPANQVWAGPPSGGQGFARARTLVAADLPALSFGSFSLASGQIVVGQVSGFAGAVAMSGDCTIVASGAVTCTKLNGVALASGANTALGTAIGSAGAFVVNGGALGTPSSGTLTNATGLPVGTGVSGLGAGVATALGTAVGSAGSPVVNGGVLGTPSAGVGTNLTALKAANVVGTATNDNATTGNIGEYASSVVLSGAAVSMTSGTAKDVTTLSLTAGDWDVSGVCATQPTGSTTTSVFICNITTTANTLNNAPSDGGAFSFNNAAAPGGGGQAIATDVARVSIASTTTYHLVAQASFAVSTLGAYGKIRARRVR